jgi:hypothetical protein
MPEPGVRERLGWEATAEELREIRRLWIAHSKAENCPGRSASGTAAGTLDPTSVATLYRGAGAPGPQRSRSRGYAAALFAVASSCQA